MTRQELADYARPFQRRDGWPECTDCAGARSLDCEKCAGTGYVPPEGVGDDLDDRNAYVGLDYEGDGR